MNSHSKSSGQVIVILIIVLGLVGVGVWYLVSNKQEMATEGKQFARDAVQRIVVQRDINYFNAHLSPQARMNFPASTQQEFMNEIARHGPAAGPVDVQGEIQFQSQFFEPQGSFHARVNYPAEYADVDLAISHPVGRWQIDNISYAVPLRQPGGGGAPAAPPAPAPASSPATAAPTPPPPAASAPPAASGSPGG